MEITDKELLAICNLSNLKMEFADIAKEIDERRKYSVKSYNLFINRE